MSSARSRVPQTQIPSCCLTPEQKETLISAVRQRPAIWDTSSDEYNDGSRRRKAYAEVAELLSDDSYTYKPAEIQIEWKKLRDVFNRTLKKVIASETSHEVCWRYWDKMQFIAPPEQIMALKMKMESDQQGRNSVDILQRLLESSLQREQEESLFLKEEDDAKPISLDWIAANCTPNNDCTDNESSSPKGSAKDSPKREGSFDDVGGVGSSANDSLEPPQNKRKRPYFKNGRLLPSATANVSTPNDTFAAFGAFVASHLKAISNKNRVHGVMLKRELMELCLKYEMDNL